jgi:hypothetical protein
MLSICSGEMLPLRVFSTALILFLLLAIAATPANRASVSPLHLRCFKIAKPKK